MNIDKTFDQWNLTQRKVLNPNSVGAHAYNIELKANFDATWQAGDIAEVQPGITAQHVSKPSCNKHHIVPADIVDL